MDDERHGLDAWAMLEREKEMDEAAVKRGRRTHSP
jgi:hypothetical protein